MSDLICAHRWGIWVKLQKPIDSDIEPAFRECKGCHTHQFANEKEPRVVIGHIE